MWFIGKHRLPCIIDARRNWQLDVIGVFGDLGGKEVMENAVAQLSKTSGPDLANICGPAETTAGQPGGEGSHGKCSGPALENIPAQAWLILASPATSPALHEKVMLDRCSRASNPYPDLSALRSYSMLCSRKKCRRVVSDSLCVLAITR